MWQSGKDCILTQFSGSGNFGGLGLYKSEPSRKEQLSGTHYFTPYRPVSSLPHEFPALSPAIFLNFAPISIIDDPPPIDMGIRPEPVLQGRHASFFVLVATSTREASHQANVYLVPSEILRTKSMKNKSEHRRDVGFRLYLFNGLPLDAFAVRPQELFPSLRRLFQQPHDSGQMYEVGHLKVRIDLNQYIVNWRTMMTERVELCGLPHEAETVAALPDDSEAEI